jgi:neutral ceramidase
MTRLRFVSRVSLFLVFAWSTVCLAAEPGWKVGLGKCLITPTKPMWMAGYGSRNHPSEGKLQDLWVKALALEAADGGRAVVVTSDLLGFPQKISQQICAAVAKRYGLERSRVMLTSTHTHCGPVLADALYDIYPLDDEQRQRIQDYSAALVPQVVAAVGEALEAPQPAMLAIGQGDTTFAHNRRNNTAKALTEALLQGQPPAGPEDHDVPVLTVRCPNGKLRAALFGYACHNTCLNGYDWCGDYAGMAMEALEQNYPGLQAMFFIGCGADQNPMPRREVRQCVQYGHMLAAAVEQVIEKPMRPVSSRLRTAFATLNLPFGEQPTREKLQELQTKGSIYDKRWSTRWLAELDRGQQLPKSYPYPVQVWRLGADQLWIVLGGEVVVDYSLAFKAKYGPHTWVTGYANDVMAYIPSHRIWEEGKYEAGAFHVYGLPALRWCEDIETRISGCVDQLVQQVK